MAPLVSIGVPVRNGGEMLRGALQSLVDQTYTNLEIIVSDNGSEDETAEIVREFAAKDERIEYHKQPRPISGIGNFEWVFQQARGEYFMWAAHDDLRSNNYVEELLTCLERDPQASLAMGRVFLLEHYESPGEANVLGYQCATRDLGMWRLLKRRSRCGCLEIYGLFRREVLTDCPFYDMDFGPDFPIVCHSLIKGHLLQTRNCRLLYYTGSGSAKAESRATHNVFHGKPRSGYLYLAVVCLRAALHAQSRSVHPRRRRMAFGVLGGIWLRFLRASFYDHSPRWAKVQWALRRPSR